MCEADYPNTQEKNDRRKTEFSKNPSELLLMRYDANAAPIWEINFFFEFQIAYMQLMRPYK